VGPRHIIYEGEAFEPEALLAYVREREDESKYTAELVASMLATNQDRGERITTTTLTGKCLRQKGLQQVVDYDIELDSMWAAFRGTMYHGQLEAQAQPGSFAEARFHVDLEGLGHFSGSPDLVDAQRGYLYDYKTNKENPRWDKPWAEHNEQVQVNRWLVDHATMVEWGGREWEGADTDRFRPVEWQGLILVYIDDKGPKPILCTKSIDIPKVGGVGTKKARVPDVWADAVVETLVRERYDEAKAAIVDHNIPAPPQGWEWASHPLCGYCSVKAECLRRQHLEVS
jgi:hypothetical protein